MLIEFSSQSGTSFWVDKKRIRIIAHFWREDNSPKKNLMDLKNPKQFLSDLELIQAIPNGTLGVSSMSMTQLEWTL